MRQIITRIFLLAVLINTSPATLWARSVDVHLKGGRCYSWMTKALIRFGHHYSTGNLLTSDEGIVTEGAPDLGGSVHVDGGVSLLLAAGAAYGLSRLRTRRK